MIEDVQAIFQELVRNYLENQYSKEYTSFRQCVSFEQKNNAVNEKITHSKCQYVIIIVVIF